MSDKELVKIALGEICHKSGYGDTSLLRQRDFEHLSAEIEKGTGTLISVSTIKRLLNGQFNHLPQAATLNAIVTCLGYNSWQDFRLKKQGEASNTTEFKPKAIAPLQKSKRRRISYYLVVAVIASALFLTIVSYKYFSKQDLINEKDAGFSIKKITRSDIPNTVVFNYDISKISGDSFFIQQSWDRDRRVRIDKNKHTLTDIYYEPGYHNAKLIVNDKVVKTIEVSIPTDGWFFFSKPELFRGLPTYIHPAAALKNGVLSLTPEDIVNGKIDADKENFYSYTFFPDKFDVSSDNFRFKVRIRVKELKNVMCPQIMYEVSGQSNSLYFSSTLPGCTGRIEANVGEHFMSGKTADLSGFGCDIRQWQDIEVVVKNKRAAFYINQKEIFSKSYTKSAGLITGLVFSSNGLCEIDQIELKDLDGKVFYEMD